MLAGRDEALSVGRATIDGATRGRGRLLLVGGEPGIGKTALVRALATSAAARGVTVRWGGSWEGQDLIAFGPWIECLRQHGGDACEVAAGRLRDASGLVTDAAGAGLARARLFGEVVDALRVTARDRPQLIVLEDLHWADRHSLDLLAAVAAEVEMLPVVLAATYRDDELPGGPAPQIGGGAERIMLDGLDAAALALAIEDVLGRRLPEADVEALRSRTAGNPLFALQLARLVGSGNPAAVPAGTRDVLARRLARTSDACHRVLGAAAVIGTDFDVDVLAAVVGEPQRFVLDALDEAGSARLVVGSTEDGRSWAFVHDLVRRTRYDSLGAGERATLHRRVLDVLSDRGAEPGALAHHAALASFAPDELLPAAVALSAAQDALRRLASAEAETLAERALAAAPPTPEGDRVRAGAWLALGEACLRSGRPQEAAAAFGEAARLGEELGDPELVARAALGFGAGSGTFEVPLFQAEQISLLRTAHALLPASSPLLPYVLSRLSVALSFVSDAATRLALAQDAVEGARSLGDDVALGVALAAWSDALAGPDHVDERVSASAEIIALALTTGDRGLELLGRRLAVVALLERGDRVGVRRQVAAFRRTAAALGDPRFSWYQHTWQAMEAYACGDVEVALQRADAAVAAAGPGSDNAKLLRTALRLWVHVDRRDADAVAHDWAEFAEVTEPTVPIANAIWAMIHCVGGRLDAARGVLDRAIDTLPDIPFEQEWLVTVAEFVVVGVWSGHDRMVAATYDMLAPYAGLGVFEGVAAVDHGSADRFLALAAGRLGRHDAAKAHATAALDAARDAGALVVAHTQADCARGMCGSPDASDRAWAASLAEQAAGVYAGIPGYDDLAEEMRLVMAAARAAQAEVASGGRSGSAPDTALAPPANPASDAPVLRRVGDTWAWTYEGAVAHVKHTKGMADLALLLEHVGSQVHVRRLEGVDGDLPPRTGLGQALDDEALASYRRRLDQIARELDRADRAGDVAACEQLEAEREAIVEMLRANFGPGGRRRAAGSDADERLRKAVSARIKAAIERLADDAPGLGAHLRNSIRTGMWCAYEPERPVRWRVER